MTTLTGSALLALAVARGFLSAEAAWRAAHVDEDFQVGRRAWDAEAMTRRETRGRQSRRPVSSWRRANFCHAGPARRGFSGSPLETGEPTAHEGHPRPPTTPAGSAPVSAAARSVRISAARQGETTARERIELLLDHDFFEEFDMFVEHRCVRLRDGGDHGPWRRGGHRVGHRQRPYGFVFAKDFTVFGGSRSETHAQKITKIQDMAVKNGGSHRRAVRRGRCPHPGGRRGARRLWRSVSAQRARLRVIPQISVIMGPCAGGDVYSPAMTDFIFMVRDTS